MMMMEKGVMNWCTLKKYQIFQQFNKLFLHWKMYTLFLTEKDAPFLLEAQ